MYTIENVCAVTHYVYLQKMLYLPRLVVVASSTSVDVDHSSNDTVEVLELNMIGFSDTLKA